MDETSGNLEKEKKHSAKKIWLTAGAATLGFFLLSYLIICTFATVSGRFYPFTKFSGVDYGCLTLQQAQSKMERQLSASEDKTLVFAAENGEEIAAFPLKELDIELDCAELVKRMFTATSDSSGFFRNGLQWLSALIHHREFTDEEHMAAFRSAASPIVQALDCEAIPFTWEVKQNGLEITRAKNGRRIVDTQAAYELIGTALCNARFHASFADQTVILPLDTEDVAGVYQEISVKDPDLSALHTSLIGEKRNASYDIQTGEIISEHAGMHFSFDDLQAAVEVAEPGKPFLFQTEVELPEVTAAELEQCLFRDVLSTYTTHASGSAGRRGNVKLSAESCNNIILNAGDIFNYNEAVGPRTAERGYQPAPAYIGGKTVDDIGGGICQTSSTIYAAALYANLEIVQRTNHGFASDYIGLGLDATVSGGGPEFEFRNSTLYPIKIETNYDEKNNLTVTILGTKTDDTYVKMVSEVLSTTPFEEIIEETDELAPGERKVTQTAYTGYDVKTYRNIYSGDGKLISSTLESRSRYKARNRIVLVGKAAEPAIDPLPGEEAGENEPPAELDEPPVEESPENLAQQENSV